MMKEQHMKTLTLVTLGVLLAVTAAAQTHVNGYTRRDGTYVAPHVRTTPDGNRFNNYSTQGNINPYTGRVGTQNPFPAPSFGNTSSGGGFDNGFGGSNQRRNPWGN